MFDWYKMAFQKYAEFTGRSTRNEFWWFQLCNLIITWGMPMVLGMLALASDSSALAGVILGFQIIYGLAVIIPSLALSIRRLHDTGRSGWNLLFGLIPLVGFIVLIVFWAQESQEGSNRWGAHPLQSDQLEDTLVDFDKDIV